MLDIRVLAKMAADIPVDTGGGCPLDKLYVMAGLAERLDLRSFAEIGVYRGRSFFPLAASFAARGGHSVGIDSYSRNAARQSEIPAAVADLVRDFTESTNWERLWRQVRKDRDRLGLTAVTRLIRATAEEAIIELRAERFRPDMIHVDGNHDSRHVMADVRNCSEILADGGILVLDDTDWPGVSEALRLAKASLSLIFETATYAVLTRSADASRSRELRAFCEALERYAVRFMTPAPRPRVSVSITTYDQVRFIGQAIESALAQQTDFDVEIVIGEDGSKDGTLDLCRAYRDRHPATIHLIERPRNLGAVANYLETYRDCRGTYVAFLEGDDFWTDPHKLQKQVDFLDRHPDYALCFHNVFIADEDGTLTRKLFERLPDTTTAADLCEGDYISTPSSMIRNGQIGEIPAWLYDLPGCDWPFDILNAECGKVKYLDEPMAAYRLHSASLWSSRPETERSATAAKLGRDLDRLFGGRYHDRFATFVTSNRLSLARALNGSGDPAPNVAVPAPLPARSVPPGPAVPRSSERPASVGRRIERRVRAARKAALGWLRGRIAPPSPAALQGPSDPVGAGASIGSAHQWPEGPPPSDLIILDDAFPHPQSAFRLAEYDAYLEHFPTARVYTTGSAFSFFDETRSLAEVIAAHDLDRPALAGRTMPRTLLSPGVSATFGYTIFAGNAWVNVEFFESKSIPFAFTLYPGGAFFIDDPASDARLQRVFGSPMFRRVIVTQPLTRDYLLHKRFCPPDAIELIHGVVTPELNLTSPAEAKVHYVIDGKRTLDICFTAHKYTPDGRDKGYDIFLDVARALAARHEDCRFHVVGGFREGDLPLDGLEGRITFYGGRDQAWLRRFYRDKDLILLCNVPFVIRPGAFDGFPTGCGSDAMLNEVALFCTDPLALNEAFSEDQDLVIVPYLTTAIVEAIERFRADPTALAALARKGRRRALDVYGFEAQMAPRLALLRREIAAAKEGRIAGPSLA